MFWTNIKLFDISTIGDKLRILMNNHQITTYRSSNLNNKMVVNWLSWHVFS